MLVEFKRAVENEYGEATGEVAMLAVNPEHTAVFFGSERNGEHSLIGLADGRRYVVIANYDAVKEKLGNAARFIELRRPVETRAPVEEEDLPGWGEDDGIATNVVTHPAAVAVESAPISFAPALIAMIHGSTQHSNRSIVKMRDGRGLNVLGGYAEVKAALDAQPN